MNHAIRGWNECLITYLLAASSPTHRIEPEIYHRGWASGPHFTNGHEYFGTRLPLGPDLRRSAVLRPLLVSRPRPARPERPLRRLLGAEPRPHGDQPRALHRQSRTASRATARTAGGSPQATPSTAIPRIRPPTIAGVISPTAALSSFPYAPEDSMAALRHFYHRARRTALGRIRVQGRLQRDSRTGSRTPTSRSIRARSSS